MYYKFYYVMNVTSVLQPPFNEYLNCDFVISDISVYKLNIVKLIVFVDDIKWVNVQLKFHQTMEIVFLIIIVLEIICSIKWKQSSEWYELYHNIIEKLYNSLHYFFICFGWDSKFNFIPKFNFNGSSSKKNVIIIHSRSKLSAP